MYEWHFTYEIPAAKFDKCKSGKLESNYKNIQVQLLLNHPWSLLPPVIHSHILSLLQCLYFKTNYRHCCVITQPTVAPRSRSSALFFPWTAQLLQRCSLVNTARRTAKLSNRPSGKQTAFSAGVLRDERRPLELRPLFGPWWFITFPFCTCWHVNTIKYLRYITFKTRLQSLIVIVMKKLKYQIRQPDI